MNKRDSILMENVWHELKAIREGQQAMASIPGDVAQLKNDMLEVKSDIRAIKAVLKDHSRLHRDHSRDIAELKAAVA